MECVVPPTEIEYFIQSIRKHSVIEIGSDQWIQVHEIILKLNQQAHIEASSNQEEVVKELIIIHGKLPILIYEIFSVFVWRSKILPKLMDIEPNPNSSFMVYTVFYHEANLVSLIEMVLYHQHGCEALREVALDLIDYSVQAVTQLIGLVNNGHCVGDQQSLNENVSVELERQKRDMLYKIGMRCITILSYIADKIDSLPLGAIKRLVVTHDTPCLLSEILRCKPWYRNIKGPEKYINEEWKGVKADALLKVTKVEAQSWFCLRQLLFNKEIMQQYEINSFRQRELAKCQAILNDQTLDQLPPLAEFKHFLATLQLTSEKGRNSQTLLLEEIPQIMNEVLSEARIIGFKKIGEQQAKIFVKMEHDTIVAMATRLNAAYNVDLLEKLMDKSVEKEKEQHLCGQCSVLATKKCFKCKRVFYCSRECQVEHWSQHKLVCNS